MQVSGKVIFLGTVACLIGASVWIFSLIGKDEELASKTEWSALQNAYLKYDNQLTDRLIIIKADNKKEMYDLLGVISVDGKTRVWIMASPNSVPKLKTMPSNLKITITQNELQKIRTAVKLNAETDEFLKNAIEG